MDLKSLNKKSAGVSLINPCNKSFTMRMEFDFCKFHYSTLRYAELPVWDFVCHFCMQIHLQILAGDTHITFPHRMQISWW